MSPIADGNLWGKRLVILGCGYLGGEVARAALRDGVRVTALTRNEATGAALAALGAETVTADLAATDWHAKIAGGADWVLNAVSSGGGGIGGYRHSYVAGMRSMGQWLRERGAGGTVVYTSSTSVYPQGDGQSVDETAPTEGAGERGRILLEAEQLLRDGAAGGRWFVLRLAGIYGPGRQRLVDEVRTGTVAGRGGHRLNLIHRDDAAAAIRAAFAAPAEVRNEIFNVADDGAATRAEVAAWLARRIGVPPPRFTGAPLGGRSDVTPDRVIANGKIKRLLGWAPRFPGFREGYENVLAPGAK